MTEHRVRAKSQDGIFEKRPLIERLVDENGAGLTPSQARKGERKYRYYVSRDLTALMGWRFMVAEFAGGLLMVTIMAVLFRAFLSPDLVAVAKSQAEKGIAGSMEGHAEMDMSVSEGPVLHRIFSAKGLTATSHYFVMDCVSVWFDVALGLIIAGGLAAWVPDSFWRSFFLISHPTLAKFWGPIVGPFVAIISFVCSVGNIPLAAVLWNGGISFGGVVAFILADLIVLPILDIYRRYYRIKMTLFILTTFYFSMSVAALVIEFVFQALGLIPPHQAAVVQATVGFNYTTVLNVAFLVLAGLMVWRFLMTGGPMMLRHMRSSDHRSKMGEETQTGHMR